MQDPRQRIPGRGRIQWEGLEISLLVSMAVITKNHTLVGLTQQKCILIILEAWHPTSVSIG